MIFDAIVGILMAIFTGILGLLPGMDAPDMGDFGASIGGSLGTVNALFPVTVLGACIASVVGVRLFAVVWAAVVWVYDRIPFKAT